MRPTDEPLNVDRRRYRHREVKVSFCKRSSRSKQRKTMLYSMKVRSWFYKQSYCYCDSGDAAGRGVGSSSASKATVEGLGVASMSMSATFAPGALGKISGGVIVRWCV